MSLPLPDTALLETHLAFPNRRQGKVRDLYDIILADGRPAVLIVATDRLSAFDVVLGGGVPGKGIVLTQMARFWFEHFGDRIEHHLLSCEVEDVPGLSETERAELRGRIMIAERLEIVPVECVARGYLAGSGFKDYRASGAVCGNVLPQGLEDGDRLDDPIFTPATKAAAGHDENVSFEVAAQAVGTALMERLRTETLALYGEARSWAAARGILLADTKFEFGLRPGTNELVLADEILTPDSSRFWPADAWSPGREQASFDKQYVRDWLQGLVDAGQWNKQPPGPDLPDAVVANTLARYLEAFERLTGRPLIN
ncbi:MAG: phosphoribosylaminoimidazolesuccinocarboxamide synthase [Pseudomonadales bacterium]|nr:phosphoribosylaminoimidazolesuccinocarboxamide synthase [Pseudomonadales bacterium]